MQQQILTELEAPNKFQHKEIKELIALSSTDDEIDVLTTIIRKHALKQQPPYMFSYAKFFFQLIISLDKIDKLMEIIRAPENEILMRYHSSVEVILFYLMKEKRYDLITEILVLRLPKYFRFKTYSNSDRKKRVSHVPFTHMEFFTRSLLMQNTSTAYNMFKELVDYIYKNGGEVSKHSVLRLLYFAINTENFQNAQFGFDIFYTDIFSQDDTLKTNLFVMLHSRTNKEDNVIKNLRNIFLKGLPIYPYTFKVIRQDIKRNNSSKSYRDQIDIAQKRAFVNGLFAEKDLVDIVFEKPDETPEIFAFKNNSESFADDHVADKPKKESSKNKPLENEDKKPSKKLSV